MRKTTFLSMLACTCIVLLQAAPALAHEDRDVGSYSFAVGFGAEPAYAGVANSVQLLLLDASGDPVTDLGPALKVSVTFEDQTASFPIEPNFEVGEFGTPGDYRAWFIPTRPGRYAFHFTGEVNGQPVDETFTSGPKTFDDVGDPAEVEFPVKDPTVGQISERLDRELPRLESAMTDVRASVSNASDDASSATTFAIIALVIGVLGLAVGIVAIARTRRTT